MPGVVYTCVGLTLTESISEPSAKFQYHFTTLVNEVVESKKVIESPIHLRCVGAKLNPGDKGVQNLCRLESPPVAAVKPQYTNGFPLKTVFTKSRVAETLG